jgi:hypothetical protein
VILWTSMCVLCTLNTPISRLVCNFTHVSVNLFGDAWTAQAGGVFDAWRQRVGRRLGLWKKHITVTNKGVSHAHVTNDAASRATNSQVPASLPSQAASICSPLDSFAVLPRVQMFCRAGAGVIPPSRVAAECQLQATGSSVNGVRGSGSGGGGGGGGDGAAGTARRTLKTVVLLHKGYSHLHERGITNNVQIAQALIDGHSDVGVVVLAEPGVLSHGV